MTEYAIGAEFLPGLSKLIEEIGEVNQQIGRLLQCRFLGMEKHWDGSLPLRELLAELADLNAAIEFVVFNGLGRVMNTSGFVERKESKYQSYIQWHTEQRHGKVQEAGKTSSPGTAAEADKEREADPGV